MVKKGYDYGPGDTFLFMLSVEIDPFRVCEITAV